MSTPIAQRLSMDHLGLEDIKASVENDGLQLSPADETPPDDEVWTFGFSYKDVRGHVWEGTFTNEILSNGQQSKVAVVRSRLQGGMPSESIDEGVLELNWAKAHLTFSLKKFPDWAKNLEQIKDPSVILKLWEKVSAHEARYFRRDEASSAGKSGG